jgi:hypothetical protein
VQGKVCILGGKQMMKGPIFLVSVPAAGKSTVVKGLLEQFPFDLRIPVHTASRMGWFIIDSSHQL